MDNKLNTKELIEMVIDHIDSARNELKKDFSKLTVDDGRAIYSLISDLAEAVKQIEVRKR